MLKKNNKGIEPEVTQADASEVASTAEPSPKKGKGLKVKLGIVGAVVVAIVVVAGACYAAFHDDPAFCNAVCHAPMDTYVENYNEGDGMARVHMEANVTCLDCHEPTLSQQVSEGMAWVTGNFKNELDMMTDYDNEQCLKCHISEEFQAAKTDFLKLNPHSDAHQVLKCTDCHKSHRDQVDYCSSCHDNEGQRMITWPLEGHDLPDQAEEEA
ncbi:MAG: cytochrome c3 family protein [Eggerthellaceae bacterium]|nr:cytochrome c3 family protein [Eggerthellaceae bacterium]